MWECIFCLCSLTNRASDSRARYRLTDVLARERIKRTQQGGTKQWRRVNFSHSAGHLEQCRSDTGPSPPHPPDKQQTLLGSAVSLSSLPPLVGSSSLYLRPPLFTYRVWIVKSRRARSFLTSSAANKPAGKSSFQRAKGNIPPPSGVVRQLGSRNSPCAGKRRRLALPSRVLKTHHGRS